VRCSRHFQKKEFFYVPPSMDEDDESFTIARRPPFPFCQLNGAGAPIV
jgi:hypothetical protein